MEPYDVPDMVGKIFHMKMDVVDLKTRPDLIGQYIELRNSCSRLLLTQPVMPAQTKEWLREPGIVVQGIVDDNSLLGVVILYLNKNNEIAFFVKDKNRGIGTRLLGLAEEVAREKALPNIWGWVMEDNVIAKHVFEKCGFNKEKADYKYYNNAAKSGVKYIKYLGSHGQS